MVGFYFIAQIVSVFLNNIRGWLTGINDPTLSTSEGDKFGLKIGYNKLPNGTTTGLWNGNISGTKWSTTNHQNLEYNFAYDGVSRLQSAVFKASGVANGKYNTNYGYDKNGNFSNLTKMVGFCCYNTSCLSFPLVIKASIRDFTTSLSRSGIFQWP